jgi:hypothetical protein
METDGIGIEYDDSGETKPLYLQRRHCRSRPARTPAWRPVISSGSGLSPTSVPGTVGGRIGTGC